MIGAEERERFGIDSPRVHSGLVGSGDRFMADAAEIAGDPDDFSGAEEELSHLSWLTIAEARTLDLPFITTVVLAEVEQRLADPSDRPAPFFRHEGGRSFIDALE